MNLKNITNLRIHFNKSLPLVEKTYELNLKRIYKDEEKIKYLIRQKNINYFNFKFYNHIEFKFYEKAINAFYDHIKHLEENDNTNIILLFFPELLKSVNLQNELDLENPKFNPNKFCLIDNNKIQIEKDLKHFFENYKNLNKKHKFMFHREELFNYMELFLNYYNLDDLKLVTEIEKKESLTLHYFSSFLRPELFFKRKIENI